MFPLKNRTIPATSTATPLFMPTSMRWRGVQSDVSDKKVDNTANGFRRIRIFRDVTKNVSIVSLLPVFFPFFLKIKFDIMNNVYYITP